MYNSHTCCFEVSSPSIHNIINLLSKLMNFLSLLSSSASLFNFNLLNAVNGFGVGTPLELSASKSITPEQVIKEPAACRAAEGEAKGPCGEKDKGEESRVEIFTKQQQLINQYMHLNIQLLSRKLENMEQIDKLPKEEEADQHLDIKSSKKKIKKPTNCGHPDREHYAKGMCSNCYHRFGRNKKPWNCPHDKLYANGMCQNCYINSYNRKRREQRDEKHPDSLEPSNPNPNPNPDQHSQP